MNALLPPWEQHNISFDTSPSCFKKDQTSETVFRKEYQQLRERYNSYFEAYTDGSRCEQKVAAAAFYMKDPDDPGITRLRDGSSVFSAELEGLHLAPKKFLTMYKYRKSFIVYTVSFSAVESLRGKNFRTKNIKRFLQSTQKIATASLGGHSKDPLTCGHFWKRKKLMDLQKQP